MVAHDIEDSTMTVLRPALGHLAEEPRRLIAQSDLQFPGYTFDFVARRTNTRLVAIEVTTFVDKLQAEAGAALDRVAADLVHELQRRHAAPARYWLGTFPIVDETRVRARDLNMEALIDAAGRCAPGEEIAVNDHVDVYRHDDEVSEIGVDVVFSGDTALDGSSWGRIDRVLVENRPKLVKAGAAGFETHLAVAHWDEWRLNARWRDAARELLPCGDHPEHVWTVDLSSRATTPLYQVR